MSEIVITKENFEEVVLKADKPVLVDFWASWCAPCRMLSPILADIAEEMEGKAVIGKVNVEDQPELAAQFQVASIPTILVFKQGQIAERSVGVRPKEDLIALL